LVVDTGSSNLAVAGPTIGSQFPMLHTYNPGVSATMQPTAQTFSLSYVVGHIACTVYRDVVTVRNGSGAGAALLSATTDFGVITSQANFFSDAGTVSSPGVFDGILGLAYRNLASDRLVPFFQALVNQKQVANVFSMELCQPPDWWILDGKHTGFLTFGAAPATPPSARLYTPLLHAEYYGVAVTAMAVGGVRLPLSCGAYNSPALSVVDSGTTDLLLPHKIFGAVVAALKASPGLAGADDLDEYFAPDESKRDRIPPSLYGYFPDLSVFFPVNGTHEFEVRIPRTNYLHNSTSGGRVQGHWFGVSPICVQESGMTIGMALLTATLTEYNRERGAIGFSNVSRATCPNQVAAVFGPFESPAAAAGNLATTCVDDSVQCNAVVSPPNAELIFWLGVACGIVGIGLLIYAIVGMARSPRRGARSAWCGRLWGPRPRAVDSGAADLDDFGMADDEPLLDLAGATLVLGDFESDTSDAALSPLPDEDA